MSAKALVIGSGIVGLAIARALAIKGYKVTVLERNETPVGASIRNFGMIWPIGQPDGVLYERAMISKSIWKEICLEAKFWHDPVGSLHLAYDDLELRVMESFFENTGKRRNHQFLNAQHALRFSTAIVSQNLKGGIYSPDEMIVDSPLILAALPAYLSSKYNVKFIFNTHINQIQESKVWSGNTVFEADEIYICTGPDFENLFPEVYHELPITKCKLQMMRMAAQPQDWRMGPSLCGGLSLAHYSSFKAAGVVLDELKQSFANQYREYNQWGIHVMVSQNSSGELIIGDSHEYGMTHDPFGRESINNLILNYLRKFARFANEEITHRWNGIYSKLTNGATEIVINPKPGITIVNGLGGAGMTLSFGLAHQIINGSYERNIT